MQPKIMELVYKPHLDSKNCSEDAPMTIQAASSLRLWHPFFCMIPGPDLLVGVRPLQDLNPGIHRHATSREEHLDGLDRRVHRVPAPSQAFSRSMKIVSPVRVLSIL